MFMLTLRLEDFNQGDKYLETLSPSKLLRLVVSRSKSACFTHVPMVQESLSC